MPPKLFDSSSTSSAQFQLRGGASTATSAADVPALDTGAAQQNSIWDFSTSSMLSSHSTSGNQIKNSHLPLYNPCTASVTGDESMGGVSSSLYARHQDPFLETALLSGRPYIASLLPSLSAQVFNSSYDFFCSSPNNSSEDACPVASSVPVAAESPDTSILDKALQGTTEVGAKPAAAPRAVSESQRLTTSERTSCEDAFSSSSSTPEPSLADRMSTASIEPKVIVSLPASLSVVAAKHAMPTYKLLDSPQRSIGNNSSSCSLHRMSATLPTPPQRRCPSIKMTCAFESSPKPALPRRVTFSQVDDIVEIPCRLDKEELAAQLEEAMAEALQEAATAEEEANNVALEAFKSQYQFAGEIMSLTSFGFGFGEPQPEATASPSLLPSYHSSTVGRVDSPSLEGLPE